MASTIDCFLVFDGAPQTVEGAAQPLFYTKMESEENEHFAENQAGIFLTLIKFATFFTNQVPVDYELTNKHEIAIMELHDRIWLSVSKLNKGSPNRQLMIAILSSCKRLYQLFFPPPERDSEGAVTKKSARRLKSSFEQIVLAISRTNLTFIHLFDSYFQVLPPPEIQEKIDSIIAQIQSTNSPIDKIAIMHSRNFLYSNFPNDVTQTLAFSLQIKFRYLFPRVLMKNEDHLYWIIGLSRLEKGPINVYAPPILYNGESYPLVGLKFKKFKIFISLKANVVPTPEVLNSIPPTIKPLKSMFNHLHIETTKGTVTDPFIAIQSSPKQKRLTLLNQKISDTSIPIAETDIIRGHSFAHMISPHSSVGFFGSIGYILYYDHKNDQEDVILMKTDSDSMSRSLECTKHLRDSFSVQTAKIFMK